MATPSPENMNLFSASTREIPRNGWKSLNKQCGRFTPAPWITPPWNIATSGGWPTGTSRWQSWYREFPVPASAIISCPAPPASATVTAPTNGCRIWIPLPACSELSWDSVPKPWTEPPRTIHACPIWTARPRPFTTAPQSRGISILSAISMCWTAHKIQPGSYR